MVKPYFILEENILKLTSIHDAIDVIIENVEEIALYDWCWHNLSSNPLAIDFLKANPEKIWWDCLSKNPAAIDLLKSNPDKIGLTYL